MDYSSLYFNQSWIVLSGKEKRASFMHGVQRPAKPLDARRSQGILLYKKIIFSQSEHPNFENFLPGDPQNSLGHT